MGSSHAVFHLLFPSHQPSLFPFFSLPYFWTLLALKGRGYIGKRGMEGLGFVCLHEKCQLVLSSSPLHHLHSPGVSLERERRFFFPTLGFLSSIVQDNWDKHRRDVLSMGVLPSYCPLNHSSPLHLRTIKITELLMLGKAFKIIECCSPSIAQATTNELPHPHVFEHLPGQRKQHFAFYSVRKKNLTPTQPSPTGTW